MKIANRKLLLLFIICISGIGVKAQTVTIADTAFAQWLRVNYPACMNGNLMDTTCTAIVNANAVDCSNKRIRNLNGIQYFDNLKTLVSTSNYGVIIPGLPSGLLRLNL